MIKMNIYKITNDDISYSTYNDNIYRKNILNLFHIKESLTINFQLISFITEKHKTGGSY